MIDSRPKLDTSGDPAIAALAIRQGGVVSARQMLAAGLGRGAIKHRVVRGRLHRVHRGVYAVGTPRLDAHGRRWAAILACGGPDAAVLSHASAAAVWDLWPEPRRHEVITLREGRPTAGVLVHRGVLSPSEIAVRDGLSVTTPTRAIIDLARRVTRRETERLCHRADMLRLLDARPLQAAGSSALRHALATLGHAAAQITRSELEERFLALVAAARLPPPQVNAVVRGVEVDFWWPCVRLVVETDGAEAHLTRRAFERDRERDRVLTLAGIRVVRFTWRDVTQRPDHVIHVLLRLHSVKCWG